jgi:hypothetical protein
MTHEGPARRRRAQARVQVPINGEAYDQALDNIAAIKKWADGWARRCNAGGS